MLLSYAFEHRSAWWVLVFALACAASSVYGWLAGTWPFGVVEGVWAVVALPDKDSRGTRERCDLSARNRESTGDGQQKGWPR